MANLAFCVFDERRGNDEGTAQDKLLYFFPETVESDERNNMVGLIQGLLQFSRACA